MRTLKTVERTIQIIEALEQLDGAGVSELADHLELSKGGVYNHLATLNQEGYVLKEGQEYRLSHRFFNLGHFVKHRNGIYNIAKPQLNRLAEMTGGHAILIIEEFGKAIYLYRAVGQQGISEEFGARRLESTDHLHVSSVGKALLAHLPPQRVEEIVEKEGLPPKTDETITDVDVLLEELVKIRDRGYSICDEEAVKGIRAVGAPILNEDGSVAGAISTSGTKHQFHDQLLSGGLPQVVMKTANVIEVNLMTGDTSNLIRY